MNSVDRSKSLELRRTIPGPQDSLGQHTWLSLEVSVVVTQVQYMERWKSAAPEDAPLFQSLITVTATGDLEIKELSTLAGKLGHL